MRLDLSQPAREPRLPDTSGLTLEEIEKRSKQAGQVAEDAREELRSVQKTVTRRTERLPRTPRAAAVAEERARQTHAAAAPWSPAFAELRGAGRDALGASAPAPRSCEPRLPAASGRAALLRLRSPSCCRSSSTSRRGGSSSRVSWRRSGNGRCRTVGSATRQAAADRAQAPGRGARARHPALQVIAQENLQLREKFAGRPDREGSGLTNAISASRGRRSVRSRRPKQSSRPTGAPSWSKLRVAGPNRAVGLLMRAQYQRLPNAGDLERRRRDNLQLLEDTQYEHLVLRERRDALLEPRRELENLIEKSQASDATWRRGPARGGPRADLRAARQHAAGARGLPRLRGEAVVAAGGADALRFEATTEQRAFLQEYILWVRSVSGPSDAQRCDVRCRGSVVCSSTCLRSGRLLRILFDAASPAARAATYCCSCSSCSVFFDPYCAGARRQALGERVVQGEERSLPLQHRGSRLCLCDRGPACPLLSRSRRSTCAIRSPLAPKRPGWPEPCCRWLRMLLPLLLLREISRPAVSGRLHFRWRKSACAAMHRAHRPRTCPSSCSVATSATMLEAVENGPGYESVGRLAGIVFLLAWAWFLHGIFRKR